MEKRDILNHLGEVVGELELPINTPEDVWTQQLAMFATAPVVVIEPVSPRQIRQALFLREGITEEVIDAALESLPSPTKELAIIEWKYALSFDRNRSLVSDVGSLLGWTSEQLDDLWRYAVTL